MWSHRVGLRPPRHPRRGLPPTRCAAGASRAPRSWGRAQRSRSVARDRRQIEIGAAAEDKEQEGAVGRVGCACRDRCARPDNECRVYKGGGPITNVAPTKAAARDAQPTTCKGASGAWQRRRVTEERAGVAGAAPRARPGRPLAPGAGPTTVVAEILVLLQFRSKKHELAAAALDRIEAVTRTRLDGAFVL